MASPKGSQPQDIHTSVDRFCAGASEPKNGLEERLDMLVAQLAVIAQELHRMNDERPHRET